MQVGYVVKDIQENGEQAFGKYVEDEQLMNLVQKKCMIKAVGDQLIKIDPQDPELGALRVEWDADHEKVRGVHVVASHRTTRVCSRAHGREIEPTVTPSPLGLTSLEPTLLTEETVRIDPKKPTLRCFFGYDAHPRCYVISSHTSPLLWIFARLAPNWFSTRAASATQAAETAIMDEEIMKKLTKRAIMDDPFSLHGATR